jgi:hypothetical protein
MNHTAETILYAEANFEKMLAVIKPEYYPPTVGSKSGWRPVKLSPESTIMSIHSYRNL